MNPIGTPYGLFWGIENTFAPALYRPKILMSSIPFKFEKVSCVTSVTYTLLCGVCFSDGNRQQRTGSCSIIYRNQWNCTSRRATTQYISTIWPIVASSVYCQRHGMGTPDMILVCTASDQLYCVKDRRFMARARLLVWV
jgi:hypothetical protein